MIVQGFKILFWWFVRLSYLDDLFYPPPFSMPKVPEFEWRSGNHHNFLITLGVIAGVPIAFLSPIFIGIVYLVGMFLQWKFLKGAVQRTSYTLTTLFAFVFSSALVSLILWVGGYYEST